MDHIAEFIRWWEAGRIVSLFDMQEFYGKELCQFMEDIRRFARLLYSVAGLPVLPDNLAKDLNSEQYWEHKRESIRVLGQVCEKLGFDSTASKAESIVDGRLADGFNIVERIEYVNIAREIDEMMERFCDDQKNRKCFTLDRSMSRYYNEVQFNRETVMRFREAEDEMLESGRCFALDRFPACVFHLSRVVEHGLLGVRAKYKYPKCFSWTRYMNKIRGTIDSKAREYECLSDGNKDSAEGRALDQELRALRSLWEKIDNMKHRWRNKNIHDISTIYNKPQTQDIFDTVRAFMDFLAENAF